jgi:hypothetical protein
MRKINRQNVGDFLSHHSYATFFGAVVIFSEVWQFVHLTPPNRWLVLPYLAVFTVLFLLALRHYSTKLATPRHWLKGVVEEEHRRSGQGGDQFTAEQVEEYCQKSGIPYQAVHSQKGYSSNRINYGFTYAEDLVQVKLAL